MTVDAINERWPRIRALLEDALDLPLAERLAFVAAGAGSDELVREQVLAMLRLHEQQPAALVGGARALIPNLAPELPPAMPAQIGAYRLLRLLGEGGMGSVYLAERADGEFNQQVAIKLIRVGFNQPELIERFKQEREILARLSHRNIAHLFDGGVASDGRPWYAMEYVEGSPITEYCDAQKLDIRSRVRLFRQALDAVAYAHRHLIVHRDIKPSNLLVNKDGLVKLLDFGIAKVIDADRLAATQTVGGLLTPHYAAPEQINGNAITTATDVHALGVFLFELLSGVRPFGATSRSSFEVQREVLEQAPPRLESAWLRHQNETSKEASDRKFLRHNSELRGDLQLIVDHCLEKQALRRYATVAAFDADLQAWLDGAPVSVHSGAGYRVGIWLRRHALAAAAGTVVVLLLIAALVASLQQAERARIAAQQALQQARTAQAIQKFLIDGYTKANPYNTDGRVVSARDLLEAGAARVDTDLAEQASVRAELHATFGRVFADLEQRLLAEREFALARDYYQSAQGKDSERALRMRAAIAEQQYYRGDVTGALQEFAALIKETKSSRGLADVFADMHTGQMLALVDLGRYAQAVRFSEAEIMPLLMRTTDPSSYGFSFALYNQAMAELYQLQLLRTLDLVERFVSLDRRYIKPSHPGLISDVQFIGIMLNEFDQTDAALALAQRVFDMRAQSYRADDPIVASARGRLAAALSAVGRYEAADIAFSTAIRDFRHQRGAETDDIARIRRDYGFALLAMHREQDARAQFETAMATWSALDGPSHPEALRCAAQLQAIALRAGDAQAQEKLQQIAALQRHLGQGGLADSLVLIAETLTDAQAAQAIRAEALQMFNAQGRIKRARTLDSTASLAPELQARVQALAKTAQAILDAASPRQATSK